MPDTATPTVDEVVEAEAPKAAPKKAAPEEPKVKRIHKLYMALDPSWKPGDGTSRFQHITDAGGRIVRVVLACDAPGTYEGIPGWEDEAYETRNLSAPAYHQD
jgi:hypothetical protein